MFLKEAGYTTIHVGKAHWGAKGTPGEDPLKLGFDVNIAGHCGGGPGSYYGKYNFSAAWRTNPSGYYLGCAGSGEISWQGYKYYRSPHN